MNIGIDLGGTNIAAAVVDENGAIIKRAGMATNRDGGAKGVTDGLLGICDALLEGGDVPSSIGLGIPGAVNSQTGEVVFAPNLPISGVNIIQELQKKYKCPIHIGNDANCAALGEVIAGGAKGAKDVVLITLGTGLGGGIISGGRLYTGRTGAAGELGHMVIIVGGRECGCGRKGCWERYASASGISRTANEFMSTHSGSLLWELCGGIPEKVNGRQIFEAFRAGDRAALLTVEQYIEHLAAGLVNIINILEPELFCIGGGISNEWDSFAAPLRVAVDAERFTRFSSEMRQTEIVRAELGNDAGIIGAALLGDSG